MAATIITPTKPLFVTLRRSVSVDRIDAADLDGDVVAVLDDDDVVAVVEPVVVAEVTDDDVDAASEADTTAEP